MQFMPSPQRLIFIVIALMGVMSFTTACNPTAVPETPTASEAAPPSPEVTVVQPTQQPVAMRLGGQVISQSEFDQEMLRIGDAVSQLGLTLTADELKQRVIAELSGQLMLADAAARQGYQPDAAALQTRLDAVIAQRGGQDAFAQWLAANHYDEAAFRIALARQLAAGWMREKIFAEVGTTADQIHASQILVRDQNEADTLLRQLQGGIDFQTLAQRYDPLTNGDLGWFPRGYLTQPELDEPVFNMQPGGYSGVIQSSLGYHIIYVLERDPARPLSPDALAVIQQKALQNWVEMNRADMPVEISVD